MQTESLGRAPFHRNDSKWQAPYPRGLKASRKSLLLGLVLAAISLFVSGCPMDAGSFSAAPAGRATPLVNRSILLEDATGAIVGYATEISADGVTVFTRKNYFVSLGWNGVVTDGVCWCTGADGTGTMFYIAPRARKLLGFAVSINGVIRTAATVDPGGIAVADNSILGFRSYYSGSGTVVNALGTVPAGHAAYPLRTSSLAEIGIPPIVTPWQLVFQ